MPRSRNSPSALRSREKWLAKNGMRMPPQRSGPLGSPFSASAQVRGFTDSVRSNGLTRSYLYTQLYKTIVQAFDFRRRTEDFFTLYELCLREGISEAVMLKYLKMYSNDGFFSLFFMRDDKVFIRLKMFTEIKTPQNHAE